MLITTLLLILFFILCQIFVHNIVLRIERGGMVMFSSI
jgi:hypothetical protein